MTSIAPQLKTTLMNVRSNTPTKTPAKKTIKSSSTLPPRKRSRAHLHSIAPNISPIEILMIRHGQLECRTGNRPIVPRCMTTLPENITEFLESLLPQSY